MTTATLTLAAFLEARLAEDEGAARAAYRSPWEARADTVWTAEHSDDDAPTVYVNGGVYRNMNATAAHIARHDPARVLAEVAAKRAILAAYEDERQRKDIHNRDYEEGLLTTDGDRRNRLSSNAHWAGLGIAVRYMVQPYATHEDFRPEWLPENW